MALTSKYPIFQPYIVGLAPDQLAVVDAETMKRMFAIFKMNTGCDLLVPASIDQFRRAAQLTAQRVDDQPRQLPQADKNAASG